MKLSILVPVYNERTVVERSLSQVLGAPLPEGMGRELIVVDDCSTDGTSAILERLAADDDRIRLFRHPVNQGKGAAVRTAIQQASGDFCLIQDADLEYDPSEYPRLLRPLIDGNADAVFGSRYLVGEQTRVLLFWHSLMNKTLTLISNMFCNLNLTDMETCYKVFRTDLLKSIPIRSNRFGFEPEIVMKSAKRKLRIYEVPISYHGRTYEEGKKISWKDGIKALGVILRFWLIDDLYQESYGRKYILNLNGTPQYLAWISRILRPYVGDRVLELNAGLGNITGGLMGRRFHYVAAECDRLYLHALRNRFLRTPNVSVRSLDPEKQSSYEGLEGRFDTVLCVNTLEYAEDPSTVLKRLGDCLEPGGRLLLLVPNITNLYNALDRAHGAKRRFNRDEVMALLQKCGFEIEKATDINCFAASAWWIHGIFRQTRLSKFALKLFDKSVWFCRRVERILPWPGLSLVAVARKCTTASASRLHEPERAPQSFEQVQEREPEVVLLDFRMAMVSGNDRQGPHSASEPYKRSASKETNLG